MESAEVLPLEERKELREHKIDHWEPVVEIRRGEEGRIGRYWEYYRDGRTFAKPIIWEEWRCTSLTG